MSLSTISVSPWNCNTAGFVPLYYDHCEGEPLFIVIGGIRGTAFPEVYGTAYLYEKFPWPEGKIVSRKECIRMARKNRQYAYLDVTNDLDSQIEKLLDMMKIPKNKEELCD